ncbi:MAG TPA: HAMP domain-containing sensor histidine kinase [Burkholderiaceae bacterium]|jgi:signal transduction histidine kinase|nr:HAMP domain-containing sensor histidine kinase [Burkholderiaceae bacterium]
MSMRESVPSLPTASACRSDLRVLGHELKTPLNGILGLAQLLMLRVAKDGGRDETLWLQTILDAGTHMLSLIDGCLMNQPERPLHGMRDTADVDACVRMTVELAMPSADLMGVEIKANTHCDSSNLAAASSLAVRQILLNLVANAVKYNRPGGRVELSVRRCDRAIEVIVADTGRGIKDAHKNRIFRMFDRAERNSSGIDGLGVGLALSQRLAVANGGRLTVQSSEMQGTTITLCLPAR